MAWPAEHGKVASRLLRAAGCEAAHTCAGSTQGSVLADPIVERGHDDKKRGGATTLADTAASATLAQAEEGNGSRDQIAQWVLGLSGAGIGIVTVLVLVIGWWAGPSVQWGETSRLVFNTLIPVFATWVGTVIAYYFSRSNFEAANRSVSELVQRLTPEERLQRTPVRQVMVPVDQMKKISLAPGEKPEELPIGKLREYLDPDHIPTQGVTRLPILDSEGRALYIIHRSLLFEHLAKADPANPDDQKLKGLMARPRIAALIKSWATVAADAMLGDAKRAMEAAADAQDVFVAQSGRASEPVVGWLTNVDITRAIEKV